MFRLLVVLAIGLSTNLFAQTESQPAPKRNATFTAILGGSAVTVKCPDSQGNDVAGKPFVDPPVIDAHVGPATILTIPLDIRSFEREIPVYTFALGTVDCRVMPFTVRNYGYRPRPDKPFKYGFPGPTIVLQKPSGSSLGDPLVIDLTNNLAPSNEGCVQFDKLRPDKPPCVCPGTGSDPQCCSAETVKPPNCFHGDNTTNLHFHGMHVSPQKPQDYVLLELLPEGSHMHEPHSGKGTVAVGSFTYIVNPIPADQPDGTQWYHPHKHGSTALQVGNGMAGALIVKGEFDEFLNEFYARQKQDLTEHVMVMQQIHDLNFTKSDFVFAPLPLINGQMQPVVTMRPNEVQRWRFVSATMEASAQILIGFKSLQAKQIAMDGVRFSNTNYQKQPLLPPSGLQFAISPGNRADFLVKAPATPGRYAVTYDVFGRVELQGEGQRQRTRAGRGKRQATNEDIRAILEAVAPNELQPALLTIQVDKCSGCPDMQFPQELPKMPPYLETISPPADGLTTEVQFRLDTTVTGGTPGGLGTQPQFFGIGVKGQGGTTTLQQFNGDCANFTEPLGRVETWRLSQNLNNTFTNSPFHVFHLHTNHFQTVRFGTTTYPEPIWMDSVTLPDRTAASADDYPADDASTVLIRQQFKDYTGAYVMHCHFLGHEDRGMMMLVQTVCPDAPDYYGHPAPRGGPDDCAICVTQPQQCLPAVPPCWKKPARVRKPKQ